MIERQVILPLSVRDYLGEIADYIVGLNSPEHAVNCA